MTRHQRRPGGFTRGPRVADHLTRDHAAFVESFLAAERAGDAATAREYHRGVPMFRRSAHQVLLAQLADLADHMTPWLWARWAAYQCTRAEDAGTDSAAIKGVAMSLTLSLFQFDRMQQIWDEEEDPVPFIAQTMGEDWAFHQLCTFELGGLGVFLEDLATGRLKEHAGLGREWLGARVSGYRVTGTAPLRLRVCDLESDDTVEVLDLGAHVHAAGDGYVIGRLVPSGTSPGLMFDSRPLLVDDDTAHEVAAAADERGGWVGPLSEAVADGRFDPDLLRSEDRELATDVPGLVLLEAATSRSALASTMESLRSGRDEIGRAAFRLLRSAAEGTLTDDLAPYVGAAAVNPHGFVEARRKLSGASEAWHRWAGLVVDPARSRLLALAAASEAAA